MGSDDKKEKRIREDIHLPEGVEANLEGNYLKVKGAKGELKRAVDTKIKLNIDNSKITISSIKAGKREKKNIGSLKAHINNMIKGVTEGHVYRLKICSSHFPMSVSVEKQELVIKNFLGEKVPRRLALPKNVNVKVEGAEIVVESADKEAAGSCAAAIEHLTKRANYDKRIFQDGIYITVKA
jgi:large subunit ribosomal protein L6